MDRPVPGGGKCCEETHLGTGTEVSGVLFLIGWREKSSQILEDAEREAPWELGKRAFQTEGRGSAFPREQVGTAWLVGRKTQ